MKKYLTLLSLFIAVTAFAADKYITSSGKLILKSGSASTIEVQSTITGPGVVPIGGMVAVMPTTQATDTWQPPATGVIKDGFMRADGHTITAQNVTDGSLIRAGTVLPNLTAKYPRGNTTSGTTGGANTQNSNVTVATQPAFNVPGHYHGTGDLGISDPGHYHGIGNQGGSGGTTPYGTITATQGNAGFTYRIMSNSTGITLSGSYVGLNGGSNGNAAFSATRATDVALTNTSVNNEPAYVEVVWVIRVK